MYAINNCRQNLAISLSSFYSTNQAQGPRCFFTLMYSTVQYYCTILYRERVGAQKLAILVHFNFNACRGEQAERFLDLH